MRLVEDVHVQVEVHLLRPRRPLGPDVVRRVLHAQHPLPVHHDGVVAVHHTTENARPEAALAAKVLRVDHDDAPKNRDC